MAEQLQNFGTTTLDGGVDDSTTSVAVVDGSVFPASGTFRVNVEDELMEVSSRSTNTLTVVRGSESTSAAAHSSGATVKAVLTAASLVAAIQETPRPLEKAKATRGSTLGVAGSYAQTSIPWTTEVFDVPGWLDVGGANPSRFTVTKDGDYLLWALVPWTNQSGERLIGYKLNGASGVRLEQHLGSTSYYTYSTFSFVVSMQATDYIEVYAESNTATTILAGAAAQLVKMNT